MTNRELNEKYPFLIRRTHWYTGKPLEEIDLDDSWWEDIPIGWRETFGIEMCDELLDILKRGGDLEDYRIIQIKEKFGTLRWYDNGVSFSVRDEYREWLRKYEVLSSEYCINCGKPATTQTSGWINYLCDDCYKARILNSPFQDYLNKL